MFRFLFGVVLGVLLLPVGAYLWFTHGNPPVAVTDRPLPFEDKITSVPLHARIDKEMPPAAPIQANEANFVAGAKIYREQCAFCHGVSGIGSKVGDHMFPSAPPLWEKHHNGEVVGVSDDPPGETYWKVANGIRLTGMPSYKGVLSEQEMWQVSLLLANADKALPPAALDLLKSPLSFGVAAAVPTATPGAIPTGARAVTVTPVGPVPR
jgi:thiosulfate dehydrogenase